MTERMSINEFLKLKPYITRHFETTMREKGFDGREVAAMLKDPEEYYPSKSHPGQYRVTGRGLCVVGEPVPDVGIFKLITIYLDKVITPPRPDQMDSDKGKRFAERYEQGLGRG